MRDVSTEQHCTACGSPLAEGDNFCTECGTAAGTPPTPRGSAASRPPVPPPIPRRPLFVDEVEPASAPETRATALAPEPEESRDERPRRAPLVLLLVVLLAAATGIGYAVGHRGTQGGHRSGGPAARPSAVTSPVSGTSSHRSGSSATGSRSDGPSDQTVPPLQPQDRLQRISRQDGPQVRRLVGHWVPQLAALAPGAGGDRSWSDVLSHYRRLKAAYPSALLLDTGRWPHSYELGGFYAVLIPRGAASSRPALSWCRAHVADTPRDCAAKLIDTRGSWADNFDTGRPGPG